MQLISLPATTRKAAAQSAPTPFWADLLLPQAYLVVLLLPTVLLMILAVPWVRYARVAPGKWMMPEMDYRYTLRDVNAEVVVFGDSTGVVSLDPLIMQQDLQTSVINIASLGSIFNVQLDDMLDHYLRYNKPPRLLVISLSPWGIHRDPITVDNSYEGIVMLVRHGSWPKVLDFTRSHPLAMIYFEFQALRSLLNPMHADVPDSQYIARHRGFAPIDPQALSKPCHVLGRYADPQVPDGVAFHFYEKYSTPRTKVLVLMAPVPDCAGVEPFRSTHLYASWVRPSAVVPADEIAKDGRHLEGAVATSYSHVAAREIEDYLRSARPAVVAQRGPTGL